MPESWITDTRLCPDTNVILERVLKETLFGAKVDFFCDMSKKLGTTTVLLPAVHREVSSIIRSCAGFFVDAVRAYRKIIAASFNKPLDQIPAGTEAVRTIRLATPEVRRRILSGWGSNSRVKASSAVGEVETAIVEGLYRGVARTGQKSPTLSLLLDETELKMRGPYSEFNDRYGDLITHLKALTISDAKIYPPSPTIDQVLQDDCHIANEKDRIIVSQAVRYMFTNNDWTGVVTNDHTDLLSNKASIEKHCLLLVCDPLYVFDEIREKFQSGIDPVEAANQSSLDYKRLVRVPPLSASIV